MLLRDDINPVKRYNIISADAHRKAGEELTLCRMARKGRRAAALVRAFLSLFRAPRRRVWVTGWRGWPWLVVWGEGEYRVFECGMVQMDCTVRCGRSSAGRYVGARLEDGVCNG